MNEPACVPRPVRGAVIGLMGVMAVAAAIAVAADFGIISRGDMGRAFGLVIGGMFVVIGNFMPKMRPLATAGLDPARIRGAERFAGWLMVLAGVACGALFVLTPLEQARRASSIVGICAIVPIASHWAWLAKNGRIKTRGTVEAPSAAEPEAYERRKLIVWLLVAFLYAFASACVAFLFHDAPWRDKLATWMLVGFGFVFALLFAVLESKRSPR
jgi:hypothetical protein